MKAALLVLVVLTLSCGVSGVPGPQLTKAPPGLGYVSNPGPIGGTLAGLEPVRHRAWMRVRPPMISISVVEYRGSLASSAVPTARRELLRVREGSAEESALEVMLPLAIDGRPARGWFAGASGSRELTAFVPYDDATFVIRIYSGDPEFLQDRQLRRAVESFRREPSRMADILVPAVVILLVLSVAWAWWRRRASTDPGDRPYPAAREF